MSQAAPEFDPEEALLVGKITAAHGVAGDVRVEPMSDFPERFRRGSRLWLRGEAVLVERGRVERGHVILKLAGIDDRAAAEALRGAELLVPRGESRLPESTYYRHEIIGLRVRDLGGALLGSVTDILVTGSNDVYVVHGERGEVLVPALDDVVREVSLERGEMVVDLPDGLDFEPMRRRSRRQAGTPKPPSLP